MIINFKHKLTKNLFEDKETRETLRLPPSLRRAARRKILYLHDAAELNDLRAPPGNRLEQLQGDLRGYFSIRVNRQWRLIFRWHEGNVTDLELIDYHS